MSEGGEEEIEAEIEEEAEEEEGGVTIGCKEVGVRMLKEPVLGIP